jgi:hypothetical protein
MRQWISRINLSRAIPRLFAVAALLFFAHQVTVSSIIRKRRFLNSCRYREA